jgi:hypothetical protein
MIDWLRRLGVKKTEPLTGSPAVRRSKTYSAQSGYAYQYFYEGHRGAEYVFRVSADRKRYRPVAVWLGSGEIEQWERDERRELTATERYAVAKLALLQAFDERETPERLEDRVEVRREDFEAIALTLGLV